MNHGTMRKINKAGGEGKMTSAWAKAMLIASSIGRAMEAPAPFRSVLRERCFFADKHISGSGGYS